MERLIPIQTLHLFPVLNGLLTDLLRSLSPDDWNKPTLARQWTVRDVAVHLLDTNMRTISVMDGYTPEAPQGITNYRELVAYLNDLNGVWVKAFRRISPAQLTDLLESTGKRYPAYFAGLDPFAPARYSVAWAGEAQSANWFDIAREYTEKWHHQQQIRDAVGKTAPLMTRELFYPCIDTFMLGLPHAYREVEAAAGIVITVTISSEAGGSWYLMKQKEGWRLDKTAPGSSIKASVIMEPEVAWKVFTKGMSPDEALQRSVVNGVLAEKVFSLIAVMA